MRLPPPSVIASWPKPNYIDPVERGPSLLIINLILITLVTIAVVGRVYSRLVVKRWFGNDDVFIILAFILDIGLTATVLLANYQYGWNRHLWDLPPSLFPSAAKVAMAAKILFILAATVIRVSLICFFYRLVKDSGAKWFYCVLHASLLWTVAVCIAFEVVTIWLCSPIKAYWTYPPIGHCMSEGKSLLAGGVISSFTDLWVTVLPIPIVMRLQMPLKQRIQVCILLCLGGIATGAGAARTYYTWKSLMGTWDETWWAYYLWIAAAIEIHIGMICACAPAWKCILLELLRILSRKISSRFSSLRSRSNQPTNPSFAKVSVLTPMRSLPWFQHTRFDFEKTRRDPMERELESLDELEEFEKSTWKGRSQPQTYGHCIQSTTTTWPMTSDTSITIRKSIDQTSSYLGHSPMVPKGWILEGSSR